METELSQIIDALPGIVWTARLDGSCDFISRRWSEFTGLGVDEAMGWGWEMSIHPEDRPRLVERFRASLSSGQSAELAARLRRSDGEFRLFSFRIAPVREETGQLMKWCVVLADIEDSRRADDATRTLEQRFQMIVDGLPAIVTIMTPDGKAVYASRHALDYFGAMLEELKQLELATSVHPDDRQLTLEAWNEALTTGRPFDRELRLSGADDVYRWLQVRGFPLRAPGGDIPLWYFLMTDLDEKKRTEVLLAAEKHLLELVTRGRPFPEVLQALCRRVETMTGDGFCGVLLVDPSGANFLQGAAPSLPAEYAEAIWGRAIDHRYGPCSLAAVIGDQVSVPDIKTDARWVHSAWPNLALRHGLQACCSAPILSANAELVGVLALYWREPHRPTGPECDLIKRLTHLASLIIDRSIGDAALRASEERKAAIIKSALDCIITLDELGAITEFNPAAERTFGYRQDEVIERPFDEVILPRAPQARRGRGLTRNLADRVAHLIGKRVETIAVRADGSEFPAELALTRTTSVGPPFFCAHLRDITERKKAEDDRRRHEAQLAHGQALSQAGSFSWKLDTDEITFSEELRRIFGFDRGAPVTLERIASRVDPDDRAYLAAKIDNAREANEASDYEIRLRMPDGRVRHMQTLSRTMRDPEGRLEVTGAVRDVTERRLAEEALRRSNAFLAGAQRISSTGSFSWRVATGEITWSEQVYRMFEYDPATPVTLGLISARAHPEDLPLLNDMIESALRGGADFEYEHRLLFPDGSIKHLHLMAHGTANQSGQMEYIGAVQDITDRRVSEEVLSKVRSELTHVARVTSLGALTASIAHEVNQPLSGIINNANACLKMLAADPPNILGAQETARRTVRDGERAADIIKRLRTLFGKRDPTREHVDLNEAAREIIALAWSDLQRNRVIVRAELAEGLAPVVGDRIQLQQVILNLILNAADAMSGIDDRPRQMVVTTRRSEGGLASLCVQDVGVGLGPQSPEKMFEAFYTTKSDGMGVGLSISRSIIDNHGGRLWVQPNHGPGVSFTFSVPCASGPADAFDSAQHLSATGPRPTALKR